MLLNAVSYIVRPPSSFLLAPLVQGLIVLALTRRLGRGQAAPREALKRGPLLAYACLGAFVLAHFSVLSLTARVDDNFNEHWPNIATIAEGNFPVSLVFNPGAASRYHYGSDLLSAQIMWLSRSLVFWAPSYLKIAMLAACVLLVYGWLLEHGASVSRALAAALAFYAFGGLFWVLGAQDHGFLSFARHCVYLQAASFGMAIALALLYLLWKKGFRLDKGAGLAALLLLSALFLVSRVDYAAVVCALALFLAVPKARATLKLDKRQALGLLLVLVVATVGSMAQAGILGFGMLESPLGVRYVHLKWPPGIPHGRLLYENRIYPIGSWNWLLAFGAVGDFALMAAPIAATLAWRSFTPLKGLLVCGVAAGVVLAHLVGYAPAQWNTQRFLAHAAGMNVLLISLLMVEGRRARAGLWTGLLCAVALAGSVPSLRLHGPRADVVPAGKYDREQLETLTWVKSVTARGAVIATNRPESIASVAGRLTPSREIAQHEIWNEDGLPSDYSRWTYESLRHNRVDYVCLFKSAKREDVHASSLKRYAWFRDLEKRHGPMALKTPPAPQGQAARCVCFRTGIAD